MAKANDYTDILVRKKVLSADQLSEARDLAMRTGVKLQDALIKSNYASPGEVMEALAEFHGMAFVDLSSAEIPKAVIELMPESVAREHVVLPFELEGQVLKVVTADPTNYETLQKLQFILNKDIQPVLAVMEQIQEGINKNYGQSETESMDSMINEFTGTQIDSTQIESQGSLIDAGDSDAPVVKLVNLIIQEAVSLRASDIHIEPFVDRVRIRYRIDGILVERDAVPRRLHIPMTARIKVMGSIDISEKRRPQDGRIKLQLQGKHYDMRVSLLPTVHGQSTVMRILDRGNISVGIRDLGFSEEDYLKFQSLIKRPNGIFLVTGPTGSGKTTTLYAALNEMNRPDRKIITAEDPVEYYLPGINQVEVKHQIGLDFARIIRSMLRQAPNIILVGEIRDKETAEIAVQASLTGHLVFSTLHTNDSPSAVTRMIDIGVAPFLIASSVIAIMAQRLVRVNCVKCREPHQFDQQALRACGITAEQAAKATLMKGRGCSHCRQSGYRGRLGAFELMRMTSQLRELTFAQAPAQELRRKARAGGMKTLREDAVLKVLKGITTPDEVLVNCHGIEDKAGAGV
jgi:type IV pilus assembly protein PilB